MSRIRPDAELKGLIALIPPRAQPASIEKASLRRKSYARLGDFASMTWLLAHIEITYAKDDTETSRRATCCQFTSTSSRGRSGMVQVACSIFGGSCMIRSA